MVSDSYRTRRCEDEEILPLGRISVFGEIGGTSGYVAVRESSRFTNYFLFLTISSISPYSLASCADI